MKAYREWRYSSTILDLSTRYSGQLHAPAALPPGKQPPPRYPLDRRLGGNQSRLDAVERRKISCPCRELNHGLPARRYTDWAIPEYFLVLINQIIYFNIIIVFLYIVPIYL
jgi:hypothetical protein